MIKREQTMTEKITVNRDNYRKVMSAMLTRANEIAHDICRNPANQEEWKTAKSLAHRAAADEIAEQTVNASTGPELMKMLGAFAGNDRENHATRKRHKKPAPPTVNNVVQTVAPAPPLTVRNIDPITRGPMGIDLPTPTKRPAPIPARHITQSGVLGETSPEVDEDTLLDKLAELMNGAKVGQIVFQTYDTEEIAVSIQSRISNLIINGRVKWGVLSNGSHGFMTRRVDATIYIGRLA
jgi:hypothetical protein